MSLVKQARIGRVVKSSVGGPEEVYPYTEISQQLEKFAELIVKECVHICADNGNTYKYSYTPVKAHVAEAASNHCGELIKRNFGIE